MQLHNFILNDIKPLTTKDTVTDLKLLCSQLTLSHIPILNNGMYIGCLSETDAHCFNSTDTIADVTYAAEGFFVTTTTNWLDVLEKFAQNNTNIMPVLNLTNDYLGYYELNDIMNLFNDTPFLSENGGILVVEKGTFDYSFSEISQIVESNNGKLLGAFISELKSDVAQITLKIGNASLNEVSQTFRRYSYNVVSEHEDDIYTKSLKARSEYLDKYLNI